MARLPKTAGYTTRRLDEYTVTVTLTVSAFSRANAEKGVLNALGATTRVTKISSREAE